MLYLLASENNDEKLFEQFLMISKKKLNKKNSETGKTILDNFLEIKNINETKRSKAIEIVTDAVYFNCDKNEIQMIERKPKGLGHGVYYGADLIPIRKRRSIICKK